MMAYELRSARYLAADIHRQLIRKGDTVVDATVGNGHDTCALAELVGPEGRVIGFDLQEDAVSRTRQRLEEAGLLSRCELHAVGHEHLAEYVRPGIRLAVFNLGWLPGGDKSVTTRWETTRKAVSAALELLSPLGAVTVCAYPGHAAGDEERRELMAFLSALRPQDFNVLHQRFLNAGPGAPECFVIQKQASAGNE
ncbi:MAG: class I SAM-dependent methyltransferase [Clostridia bacterium]|nr:class I SAM-dependent methyltransferase [Clostridia bacterium]